jgi:hypothetical protein
MPERRGFGLWSVVRIIRACGLSPVLIVALV